MIDVVLPCLDEVGALPWVLRRLPAGGRAIVVDNGSRDGSAQLARDLGATVVACPTRGYGAACHAGLEAATADLVAFCDCDATIDPSILDEMAPLITSGAADMVVGRRRPQRGAWSPQARLANVELARRFRRRTGIPLYDIGPIRISRRTELLALGIEDRRSGYPLETVVRAADAGWRLVNVDVPYLVRTGKSKVTGTWRGTWQAIQDMSAVLAQ